MKEKIFYSEYFYNRGSKDTDVLEKNVNEYPASSLGAFLLLYHYKKTNHPDFEKLAKKAVLLFNNPQWLQFQLHHQAFQKTEPETPPGFAEENKALTESDSNPPIAISSGENFMDESTDLLIEEKENVENVETVAPAAEIISAAIPETTTEQKEDNEKAARTAESVEIVPGATFQAGENAETGRGVEEDEIIAFEPLHTVDYFASQGIKITDELITNDKLGSQMKSFTEWLKSMKKLHPSKLQEQSMATEKLIQSAADESNINTEILTEAMAEVLIKQDKKEKAIEMFSKLSLINPAKSAYFAARIESIKSS